LDAERRSVTDFLSSKALARLVAHFLVHPDQRKHLRALHRHTGLGMRSLRRELEKLEAHGLVERRREDDGRLIYRPRLEHPGWKSLEDMVRTFALPEEVLDDALADLAPRIRAGFLYGSMARGDTRPDSDIDLFVVADSLERSELSKHLMDAGMTLGREVNAALYESEEFRQKSREPGPYLRSILAGPKIWLFGSEEGLRALRS